MPRNTIVAWIILFFTIIPFLVLCIYSVPLGDDFWYASAFRKNGIMGTQELYYNEWSGRYMSTFLISTLNPLSYGCINLGFLHPLVLLLGTSISLKFLINTIINYFQLDISKILSYSILLFFYLNYLPDVGETFYWLAGAYTYQVPLIFLMIYVALLIKIFKIDSFGKNARDFIFAIFCLFVILGSNEVIVVYVCCFNSLVAIYFLIFDKKNVLKFFPLLLFTIVVSYFMIFADGNFARAALFEKPSFHLLKATIHSLSRGMFVLFFWLPTLLLLLLCIPGISNVRIPLNFIPEKYSRHKSFVLTCCLMILVLTIFAGFFPSIYTTNWIPQRAYTPIFFVFIFTTILLLAIVLNRVSFLTQINQMLTSSKASSIFLVLLVVTLSNNCNVMNAYVDITSGKASAYYKQVMDTYKQLETNKKDVFLAKELSKRPMILPVRWPAKHNLLVNGIWEEYFHIKIVELD